MTKIAATLTMAAAGTWLVYGAVALIHTVWGWST
jgi:hypothetical protein